FVLQALQFEPVEINLGDVAGLVAVAADFQNLVPVVEIVLRHAQHGLGLKDADKGVAQVEKQIALRVGLLGHRDGSALPGNLEPKMPLVPPLEQITDAGGLKRPGKWPPLAVVGSDL